MNKNYKKLVKKHYKKEAREQEVSLKSTMHDLNTRRLEINSLVSYIKSGDKCLEVGCGNGSGSIEISKSKKIDLTGVDFSSDLLAYAKKQPKNGIKGKINFKELDILKMKSENSYNVVFTERCIINLMAWEDQKAALNKMAGSLKKGGRLILLEAFKDGLEELNKAREEIGLSLVKPAYHNLHLDKDKVITHLEKMGMKFVEENNFLSSYYYGSRVIYPAMARAGKKEIIYNSSFVKFFAGLPPMGNYAHIKILVFKKK